MSSTSRADDSWLYLPTLRRVRRYSTAARSDTLFGTDIDQDSIWGFNSKPEWWDFKLLAEKEILVPMHAGKYTSTVDYQGAVVKSCIHCHQIGDAVRDLSLSRGEKLHCRHDLVERVGNHEDHP